MKKYSGNVTWYSGTIRQYESIISVGAKYCFLNKVSHTVFVKYLSNFMMTSPNICKSENDKISVGCYIVDDKLFDIRSFARSLNESIDIVSKMKIKYFSGCKDFTDNFGYLGPKFDCLYVCPKCLENCYHSVLHQMPDIIPNCYIHDDQKLIGLDNKFCRYKYISLGFHVKNLYEKWFGIGGLFCNSDNISWLFNKDVCDEVAVNNLISIFNELNNEITHDKLINSKIKFIGNVNVVDKFKLLLNLYKIQHHGMISEERHVFKDVIIKTTQEIAGEIIGLDFDVEMLMNFGLVQTYITNEMPRWRREKEKFIKKIMQNHHGCDNQLNICFEQISNSCVLASSFFSKKYTRIFILRRLGVIPCIRLLLADLFLRDYTFNTAVSAIKGEHICASSNDLGYLSGIPISKIKFYSIIEDLSCNDREFFMVKIMELFRLICVRSSCNCQIVCCLIILTNCRVCYTKLK